MIALRLVSRVEGLEIFDEGIEFFSQESRGLTSLGKECQCISSEEYF
jgi:hypothetical protein